MKRKKLTKAFISFVYDDVKLKKEPFRLQTGPYPD